MTGLPATVSTRNGIAETAVTVAEQSSALVPELLTRADRIRSIASEWDLLLETAQATPTFFQRPCWALACLAMMDSGELAGSPCVVTLRRGKRLVFVAPLQLRRLPGLKAITWIGDHLVIHGDIVVDAGEDARDMLTAAFAALPTGIDCLRLDAIRADSAIAGALPGQCPIEWNNVSPAIDLARHGDVSNWLASRSRSTRKNWNRRERQLAEKGQVGFAFLKGEDADGMVAAMLAFKREWARQNAVLSRTLDDSAFAKLLDCLVAQPRMDARVSVLTLDGAPIALELGFVIRQRYFSYLCAYDPRHAACSPGSIQTRRTIEACFAEGFRSFELMPPNDAYKQDWAETGVKVGKAFIIRGQSALSGALARLHAMNLARTALRSLPAQVRPAVYHAVGAARATGDIARSIGRNKGSTGIAAALSALGVATAAWALSE